MATHFSASDGPQVAEIGRKALKKPNPVYLVQLPEEFNVQTNEGPLKGKPGDYLAYDPISGHVWPVAESYVQQHYDFFDGDDE